MLTSAALPATGAVCRPAHGQCIRFHGKYVLSESIVMNFRNSEVQYD